MLSFLHQFDSVAAFHRTESFSRRPSGLRFAVLSTPLAIPRSNWLAPPPEWGIARSQQQLFHIVNTHGIRVI